MVSVAAAAVSRQPGDDGARHDQTVTQVRVSLNDLSTCPTCRNAYSSLKRSDFDIELSIEVTSCEWNSYNLHVLDVK